MHGLPLAIYAGIISLQLIVLAFLRDTNGEVKWTDEPEVLESETSGEGLEIDVGFPLRMEVPSRVSN